MYQKKRKKEKFDPNREKNMGLYVKIIWFPGVRLTSDNLMQANEKKNSMKNLKLKNTDVFKLINYWYIYLLPRDLMIYN